MLTRMKAPLADQGTPLVEGSEQEYFGSHRANVLPDLPISLISSSVNFQVELIESLANMHTTVLYKIHGMGKIHIQYASEQHKHTHTRSGAVDPTHMRSSLQGLQCQ